MTSPRTGDREMRSVDKALPVVKITRRDKYVKIMVTVEELEELKLLALSCGYETVSDLMRAGIALVKERVEQ